MVDEFRKAKRAQANSRYSELEGATKAKEAEAEKLKLAGFWGTPEEAAASSATAADPDPLDLAVDGGQSRGEEGPALHLKARAVRLTPREPHFRLVPRLRPDSVGPTGGRSAPEASRHRDKRAASPATAQTRKALCHVAILGRSAP